MRNIGLKFSYLLTLSSMMVGLKNGSRSIPSSSVFSKSLCILSLLNIWWISPRNPSSLWSFSSEKVVNYKFRLFLLDWTLVDYVFQGIFKLSHLGGFVIYFIDVQLFLMSSYCFNIRRICTAITSSFWIFGNLGLFSSVWLEAYTFYWFQRINFWF